MNIDEVVLRVIDDLRETHPKLMQSVLEKNYFITRVSPSGSSKDALTLVDFTRPMTYDQDAYINHSQSLYTEFINIPGWYEC